MTISVEHLRFSYSRMVVLNDMTAEARPGRITAIIGPNAAGKSTLLRCMIGALKPDSGCVLIDQLRAHEIKAKEIARRIAYVPQRSIVSGAFTVSQVVELGRFALTPSSIRVRQAIEKLDLVDIAERPHGQLSVGQQQRVMLARAMVQLEPNGHLILDEPTSAMDWRHISSCVSLFVDLANAGATIVVAMHDLSLAASLAHDIWIVDAGRIVYAGETAIVMEPRRLQSVFGVAFQWLRGTDGQSRLVAQTPVAS